LPWPQYQELLDGRGPGPYVSGAQNYDLPIWINLVSPETPGLGWLSLFDPLAMVASLNGYFASSGAGIQFYLCGVSYLYSDALVHLDLNSEQDSLRNLAASQNPNYDNVINVNLVNSLTLGTGQPSGFAGLPISGVGAVYISSVSSYVLAHEMGHYLSLPHTYAYGPLVLDPQHPERAQYVNDTVTLIVNGSPTIFDCHQTGDGFCDTNADPNTTSNTCLFSNACDVFLGCTPYPNDPLGVLYNPDLTLLMSDFQFCTNRFTAEQVAQMESMLAMHAGWSFLIDSNEPACQIISSANHGLILRDCIGIDENDPIKPMQNVSVPLLDQDTTLCGSPIPLTNAGGKYLNVTCVYPYNGTGLLSVLPNISFPAPLEGVTPFDLTLISKHILGIEALNSPFQLIAADANNSGSITTTDIIELRKLILGIYQELPNNSSWRYVPDYCFLDPDFTQEFYGPGVWPNPFSAVWVNPEEPMLPSGLPNQRVYGSGTLPVAPNSTSWMDHVLLDPNGLGATDAQAWSFWGIKIGDVNCSADSDGIISEDPDDSFVASTPTSLAANQEFTLKVKALGSAPVVAWQLGVAFAEDSLQFLQVMAGNTGETFSADNFGLTEILEGNFRALNFSETGVGANLNNKSLFSLNMKALHPISDISQHFKLKNAVLPTKFFGETGDELENISLQLEVTSAPIGMQGNNGNTVRGSEQYEVHVFPVPFSDEINFSFSLKTNEFVRISLYDNLGRLLATLGESMTKGPNSLSVHSLAGMPSGLYWYKFEAGTLNNAGKILKK
jgi:hypothetical protein